MKARGLRYTFCKVDALSIQGPPERAKTIRRLEVFMLRCQRLLCDPDKTQKMESSTMPVASSLIKSKPERGARGICMQAARYTEQQGRSEQGTRMQCLPKGSCYFLLISWAPGIALLVYNMPRLCLQLLAAASKDGLDMS